MQRTRDFRDGGKDRPARCDLLGFSSKRSWEDQGDKINVK